jgi:hypothetical protein
MVRLIMILLVALSGVACKTPARSASGKAAMSEFDEHPWRDPNRIHRVRNAFNTFR